MCHHKTNGRFLTQCLFFTLPVEVLVHLFGKWQARRWIIYSQRSKFINIKLHVCHIWTKDKTRHSKRKLINVCPTNFMKNGSKYEKNTSTWQYPCHWYYHVILEQSRFIPRWDNLPSGHQQNPLLGLILRYMYWGQKYVYEKIENSNTCRRKRCMY